ncbi:MAG: hypothetical protein IID40_09075 [Planctomycetes bacterium]|nr:hypothetical protein [Planctomycetota bacterium]
MIRKTILVVCVFGIAISLLFWRITYLPTCKFQKSFPTKRLEETVLPNGDRYTLLVWGLWSVRLQDGRLALSRQLRLPVGGNAISGERIGFGGIVWSRSYYLGAEDDTLSWDLTVELWAPSVGLAAYPVVFIICTPIRRRRFRRAHGLCIYCGYDLTGNVSARCPECGKPA